MPTTKDILNELKWHPNKTLEGVEIYYTHRGADGDFKVLDGIDIVSLGKSFMVLEEGRIPYHRIFKIVSDGNVLFER